MIRMKIREESERFFEQHGMMPGVVFLGKKELDELREEIKEVSGKNSKSDIAGMFVRGYRVMIIPKQQESCFGVYSSWFEGDMEEL